MWKIDNDFFLSASLSPIQVAFASVKDIYD